MRFWDSSALVPVLLEEPSSPTLREALREDASVVTWWATTVECTAAVARAARDGRLDQGELALAIQRLEMWKSDWVEVDASAPLRGVAERLVRTHPLRAADALQLAAALAAAEGSPVTLPFVTGDVRLADAAVLEGFPVLRFDRP